MSPSSSDAPIQLERYAELSAEAEHAPPLSALLARESIDEATWASAQAYWLARMADEARRQRYQATSRYQKSFDRRRRALEAERRAKAGSSRAASVELAPSLAAAPGLAARPAPDALTGAEASPPMGRPAAAEPAPVGPVRVGEDFASPSPPPAWPAPSAPARVKIVAPPISVDASPAPPEPARPRKAPATMVGVLLTAPGEALPFREGPPAPPAVPERPSSPAISAGSEPVHRATPLRRVDLGSTVFADPDLERAAATPFEAGPVTEPTPRRKLDLGATMMVDEPSDAPAMPFAKPPPQAAGGPVDPRRPAEPLRAAERMRAPIAGASSLGATLPPTTQPLPGSPAEGGARRFSINVFASLTAEIAENPADVEAIRRRYGVGEAEHREESERWTAAFDADDELRQRYLGIVQRYRGYVRGQMKG